MTEDTHLKVLKLLEDNPRITQRQLANELGFSLGKVNYCLKALMGKGLVKASNFKTGSNKCAYVYVLTLWRLIIATRKRLIHGCLGVGDDTLWSIVTGDVVALLPRLIILQNEEG
jgi:EPS-associated MarR family transcriptional regulator